jgi:hypothetical protein
MEKEYKDPFENESFFRKEIPKINQKVNIYNVLPFI